MDGLVQVSLFWVSPRALQSSAALVAITQVAEGKGLTLGEHGDLFVPVSALGDDRVPIVERRQGTTSVMVPVGAHAWLDGVPSDERTLLVDVGHAAELAIGSFRVKIEHGAERRPAGEGVIETLRGAPAGCIAGSALVHAAVVAAIAFIAPTLAAAEEESFDRDRLALMQRMLDASAERERERTPEDAVSGEGEAGRPAAPAKGAEGEAGKLDARSEGRMAVRGNARPTEVTMAREHALADASNFGAISILASLTASDPGAPVVPWGTVSNGSDDVSKIGHLFGATLDDAAGIGGVGLAGLEQGGGGTSSSIGLNGFGPLGTAGSCSGPGPCGGIGRSRDGRLPGGHPSHFKGPRYGAPETNGRLAAEVIQRIVRLNDGRYRYCYENGLRGDPSLHGRVTVKFMIDRSGAVAFAADGGSDIPDEGVRACVVRSFLGLSFPQPENGTVTVVYPIVFSPE
jgi:hypothetical protein